MNGFLSGVTVFLFVLSLGSIAAFLAFMLVEYGIGFLLLVLTIIALMIILRG